MVILMNDGKGRAYRKRTEPVFGSPESCDEILNKYGTYEVQDTADSDNAFPKISHGLPKSRKKKNYKGFDNKKRES